MEPKNRKNAVMTREVKKRQTLERKLTSAESQLNVIVKRQGSGDIDKNDNQKIKERLKKAIDYFSSSNRE